MWTNCWDFQVCGPPGQLQVLEQRASLRTAYQGFFVVFFFFFEEGGITVCVSLFEQSIVEGLVLSGDACSGSGVQM